MGTMLLKSKHNFSDKATRNNGRDNDNKTYQLKKVSDIDKARLRNNAYGYII